jgi:alpha-galactosidase
VQTWSELIASRLRIPTFEPIGGAVPFDLQVGSGFPYGPARATEDAWSVRDLVEVDGDWHLTATTARGLEASFTLRFFDDTRSLECWGEVTNRGAEPLVGVTRALVLDTTVDLGAGFESPWVRSVNGAGYTEYFPPFDFAIRDRQLLPVPWIGPGVTVASDDSGRPSTEHLPCAILGDEGGTSGLAFMLEWSGTWSMMFRRPFDREKVGRGLQVAIGIHGLDLDLRPGQSLPLPRLLIAAFDGDLEAGGNALRRHIRRHVTPSLAGEEVLPPLSFNQWFGFGNSYTAEILRPEIRAAAEAGLEYFVVDGGWFAGGFPAGIGNWDRPDPQKFPDGVAAFADEVRAAGMKYGTWFEPEWAHIESDLYREHPEWFLPTPRRRPTGLPGVLLDPATFTEDPAFALLDFGLVEVRDWWVERIARAYDEWGVRWIRWDANHSPSTNWTAGVPVGDIGRRQIEHVQGLYSTLDRILARCPDLFIEQCAGGGTRIDLGMIRRGHSFWMNDITSQSDMVRAFQHGLNSVIPGNYANTNIAQARHDFTDYDYLSHATGGLGYSGRLSEAPRADFEAFARTVAEFAGYRHLLLADYARPTGQPTRADGYAKVVFTDGAETATFEYNHAGPGSAKLTRTPPA